MNPRKKIKLLLRKQLGPKTKITKDDIKLKLFEIEQKNLSSCFSATSRESRDYAFRNKTQGPSVG